MDVQNGYNIKRLGWDTEHFGFNVGECVVDNVIDSIETLKEMSASLNLKLLYIVSSMRQSELECGGLALHERVTYKRQRAEQHCIDDSSSSKYRIESFKGRKPSGELIRLSRDSGAFSRFCVDPEFPQKAFLELYDKWLENSIFTDYATDVLVCMNQENVPIGLLTYKTEIGRSDIGLLAVSPEYRKRGIARLLLNSYMRSVPREVESCYVVTQGNNFAARKCYESLGYGVDKITNIYHLWT